MKIALAAYLASIPDGAAKADGIKLGEAVAAKVLEARANDGHDAADDYRPNTTPGVYVPTPITAASKWGNEADGDGYPSFDQDRLFRWRARNGQLTTTRLRTTAARPVQSVRRSRPRPPGSGSWSVHQPTIRSYASS